MLLEQKEMEPQWLHKSEDEIQLTLPRLQIRHTKEHISDMDLQHWLGMEWPWLYGYGWDYQGVALYLISQILPAWSAWKLLLRKVTLPRCTPNPMTVYTEETTAGRAVLFKNVDLAIGFCSELTFRPWHRAVSCTSPQQWLGYLKTHDKCCPSSPGFSLLFQQWAIQHFLKRKAGKITVVLTPIISMKGSSKPGSSEGTCEADSFFIRAYPKFSFFFFVSFQPHFASLIFLLYVENHYGN